MEYAVEIYNLSAQFYLDYPKARFPEVSRKKERPYSCLLIEYMDDILICIPFRSNVKHKYGYHFKNSVRSRKYRSGLDYTKIALIKDMKYIDTTTPAVVDQDEYKETIQNLPRIVKEAYTYVLDYKNDLYGIRPLHPKERRRRYGMSTLPYFKDLL